MYCQNKSDRLHRDCSKVCPRNRSTWRWETFISSKITEMPVSRKTFTCQSTVVRIHSGVAIGSPRRWNVVLAFSKETFIDENTLVLPVIDGLLPVTRTAGEQHLRYIHQRRKADIIVPAVSHPARCCPCYST